MTLKVGNKTFYHFDLPTDHLEGDNQSVEQIVGHYISKQYHSQFDSNRNEIYTFIEKFKTIELSMSFINMTLTNKPLLTQKS